MLLAYQPLSQTKFISFRKSAMQFDKACLRQGSFGLANQGFSPTGARSASRRKRGLRLGAGMSITGARSASAENGSPIGDARSPPQLPRVFPMRRAVRSRQTMLKYINWSRSLHPVLGRQSLLVELAAPWRAGKDRLIDGFSGASISAAGRRPCRRAGETGR